MVVKSGFIYIWMDRKYPRFYIGSHWGEENDSYICSSRWMRDAHRRRPEDFKRRIIARNIPRDQIYIEEQKWLDLIKREEIAPAASHPRYYNLNLGVGDFWHLHAERRKEVGAKISAANTGKKHDRMTEEVKRKISEAKKSKQRKATAETRQKMREAKLGTTRTEEAKRKTTESLKLAWEKRERAPKRAKMPRDEQNQLTSVGLKSRWADPVWKAAQQARLREGWLKRKQAA